MGYQIYLIMKFTVRKRGHYQKYIRGLLRQEYVTLIGFWVSCLPRTIIINLIKKCINTKLCKHPLAT